MKGETEASIAEFRKAISLPADSGEQGVSTPELRLGQAYAFWGKRADAMKILERWKASPHRSNYYDVALIYVGLGERDRAFELLEKEYENHNLNLLSLRTDPRLGSFRSDPRYQDLMRRMGLEP